MPSRAVAHQCLRQQLLFTQSGVGLARESLPWTVDEFETREGGPETKGVSLFILASRRGDR